MNKTRIEFEAMNGQELRMLSPLKTYAAHTINYIEAHFNLAEHWLTYENLSAIWFSDSNKEATELDGSGMVIIPQNLLKMRGSVHVNLCAWNTENGKTVKRLTSYPVEALRIYNTKV